MALQNFRPGRILQMGGLDHVRMGISSYEKREVQWVGWLGNETVMLMVAKIGLKVTLDGKGNVVCTCGNCGPDKCWH